MAELSFLNAGLVAGVGASLWFQAETVAARSRINGRAVRLAAVLTLAHGTALALAAWWA